jgi:hypothetical protein
LYLDFVNYIRKGGMRDAPYWINVLDRLKSSKIEHFSAGIT